MDEIWSSLLKPVRFRPSAQIDRTDDFRNPFENDYTRIIVSPHFRRLQDKAQVFPYDDSDYVRTRLTHSLEVSSFARSLGLSLENYLYSKGILSEERRGHISSILATAGLVHDIGNPPFGHFGEECVRSFFQKFFIQHDDINLNSAEKSDFLNFEGNAQSFRILRKLGPALDSFSYNLTLPVLSTIMKYPVSSLEGNKKGEKISRKKFGFFQSEVEDFNVVSSTLGIGNNRHPLTFLLEAADDIAYSVSDIEDGCKKGIITRSVLMDSIHDGDLAPETVKELEDAINEIEQNLPDKHPSSFVLLINNFRIRFHSKMLHSAYKCFIDNYDAILSGSFDNELLLASDSADLRRFFKKMNHINFNHPSVIKREIAGHAALNFHLDTFADVLFTEKENHRSIEKKFNSLISKNYRYVNENYEPYPNETYKKLLLLTDFISGMTDTYAIKLYHELSGISPH